MSKSAKRKTHDAAKAEAPPTFDKPTPGDRLTQVFGGRMALLLPKYDTVPDEFKRQSNPWVKWQMDWFYEGLKRWPVAKEGIDLNAAMAHLKAIQSSWEPQHEHKEAGVAYLASLWFSSPDGEPIKEAA